MSVNLTINGKTYTGINRLREYGVDWRPEKDVIDIPTGTYTITENTTAEGVDVSKYKRVVVQVAGSSGSQAATLQRLIVTLSTTTFSVGATQSDILNAVSSAQVTLVTSSGNKTVYLTAEDLTVSIPNPSGTGTIVSGSNTVVFLYGGTSAINVVYGGSLSTVEVTLKGSNFYASGYAGQTTFKPNYGTGYVTLTLVPNAGYFLGGIKVIRTDVSPTVDVTSAASTTITKLSNGQYTVRWNAMDAGTTWRIEATATEGIVPEIFANDCTYVGESTFEPGKAYALKFVANAGYEFVSPLTYVATKDGTSLGLTPVVSTDKTTMTITANIVAGSKYRFGATPSRKSGENLTLSYKNCIYEGPTTLIVGSEVELLFLPNSGYEFDFNSLNITVKKNGSTITNYTRNVLGDGSLQLYLTANTASDYFDVSVTATAVVSTETATLLVETTHCSYSGPTTIPVGTTTSVVIRADTGYSFSGWTDYTIYKDGKQTMIATSTVGPTVTIPIKPTAGGEVWRIVAEPQATSTQSTAKLGTGILGIMTLGTE